MSILSRRARHQYAKGTATDQTLLDWYAVSETVAAGSTFDIPGTQGLIVSLAELGQCQVDAAGQQVLFKQKEILLVKPKTNFKEQVPTEANWRASYLVFNGHLSDRFAETFWSNQKNDGLRLISTTPPSWRQDIRKLIQLSFGQPPEWDWLFLKTLTQLFEDMVHHASKLAHSESLVARAKSSVYRDIHRPWSIEELANMLSASTSQFAHKFRKEAGISPGQWIRQARLQHARNLLRQGLSVTQVADEMGYANPFNFTRAYKIAFGIPPSNESGAVPKGLH